MNISVAAQPHVGAAGTGGSLGLLVVSWVVKAMPVLSALSVFFSILVSVATLAWYGHLFISARSAKK